MAVITLGALISDIRGSIGGVSFLKNISGTVAKSRDYGKEPSSRKQQERHSELKQLNILYNNLSSTEKTSWRQFADLNTKMTAYSEPRKLTGNAWFISVNYNLRRLGQPIKTTAPTYVAPPITTTYDVSLSPSSIKLLFSSIPNNANQSLVIYATPPVSSGSKRRRDILRVVKYGQFSNSAIIDITNEWEIATGLVWMPAHGTSCLHIMVQVCTIDLVSGITGEGRRREGNTCVNVTGIGSMIIGSTNIVG